MQRGTKGSQVKALQVLLNQAGYKIDADGDYGSQTEDAVKAFQRAENLTVTGTVDALTFGHITAAAVRVKTGVAAPANYRGEKAPSVPTFVPSTAPGDIAFYEQPWFIPVVAGGVLTTAVVVGYFLLRR